MMMIILTVVWQGRAGHSNIAYGVETVSSVAWVDGSSVRYMARSVDSVGNGIVGSN